MHDIEQELIKATEYKVLRKFSDRQDYLKSIFNAANKLSDATFNDLSEEAFQWVNACVEAMNTKRDGELPDFDETDEFEAAEVDEKEVETDGGAESEPEIKAAEEEVDEVKAEPKKRAKAKKEKEAKIPPKPKKIKDDPEPEVYLEDAVQDKWGCIVGSKNALALAMFEKGATTKEVRASIGGTYYNILGKMVQRGHRLEREGALMKLTHKDDLVSSRKPKK